MVCKEVFSAAERMDPEPARGSTDRIGAFPGLDRDCRTDGECRLPRCHVDRRGPGTAGGTGVLGGRCEGADPACDRHLRGLADSLHRSGGFRESEKGDRA